MSRLLLPLLAVVLVPDIAVAHPGHEGGGWSAGFTHPFLGWDHMVVMVAIGLWAAQSGRWWIPAVFVSVMSVGAGAALLGFSVPGVEPVILASTVVVAALALLRPRVAASLAFGVVTLFAFFHGFAHGAEMPGENTAGWFIAGFVGASLVLHAAGFGAARALVHARKFWRARSLTS